MKNLLFAVAAALFLSCAANPSSTPVAADDNGSAIVSVRIGAVGALAKRADISLARLIVSLSAAGQPTINDTFALSGTSSTTINKTYSNLASLITWTLSARSLDSRDSVIHSGSTTFVVQPRQTASVSLNLDARYSMLKANFFPIRDSVTRCVLLVDGIVKKDSSFARQSHIGDTVKLAFDYLKTGVAQRIKMSVYGTMWGLVTLLYTGDTLITAVPGVNATYNVLLKWVGPSLPPSGQGTMSVVLGAAGTVTMNGTLQLTKLVWSSSGLTGYGVEAFAASGTTIFAGTQGYKAGGRHCLFFSTDNGATWNPRDTGLNIFGYVTSFAVNGTNIYAGMWDYGVYLSNDNGLNWTEIGVELENVYTVAVSGTKIFAGTGCSTGPTHSVYSSTDNGATWDTAGLAEYQVVNALAVSGTKIFAGSHGMFLSNDNGATWHAAGLTDFYIYSLAISGTHVYAGTHSGVFVSTDNGVTWIAAGLAGYDVAALATNGTVVFAGTITGSGIGHGVFMSMDNGATWTAQNTGLANTNIRALSVIGTRLFAGTDGGAFISPIP
jgi:photosystem II stability/assembly factor-like uncharacterized protein